jgi:hypothetical protein
MHTAVKRGEPSSWGLAYWRAAHSEIFASIPRHRYDVVGFVDEPHHARTGQRGLEPVIGTIEQLEQILMRQAIDEVVIALPVKSCYHHIQRVLELCERAGVQAKYGADMFESTVAFPRYHAHGDRAFVAMQVVPDAHWLAVKRASTSWAQWRVLCYSPAHARRAALIKLTSSGPIVYAQDRCGLNRRAFRMHKFRSMYSERRHAAGVARGSGTRPSSRVQNTATTRDDAARGVILRKTSIDELPQLWNVLVR